jgi:hypothetical protein
MTACYCSARKEGQVFFSLFPEIAGHEGFST